MLCRGVGLGVTSQLSSSITSINMSGFKFGSGANALLLGTNVIGSIIAWALMFITLLENPLGSALTQVGFPDFLNFLLNLVMSSSQPHLGHW